MNLLNAFLNPRNAVAESFENPHLGLVVGLNLFHVIVFLLISVFVGTGLNIAASALALLNSFFLTLVFSVILFFVSENIIRIVRPSTKMPNKFLGIAQAFSMVFLYVVIFELVFVLPFIVNPEIKTVIDERAKGIITDQEMLVKMNDVAQKSDPFLSLVVGLLVNGLFLLMTLYSVYLVYIIIAELFTKNFIQHAVLTVVVVLLLYLIMSAKQLFLGI